MITDRNEILDLDQEESHKITLLKNGMNRKSIAKHDFLEKWAPKWEEAGNPYPSRTIKT